MSMDAKRDQEGLCSKLDIWSFEAERSHQNKNKRAITLYYDATKALLQLFLNESMWKMRSLLGFLFGITKLIGLQPSPDTLPLLPSSSLHNSLRGVDDNVTNLSASIVPVVVVERKHLNYNLSVSDGCVTREQSLICYRKSNGKSGYSPISEFERLRKRLANNIHFNSFVNCENSATRGFHLHYDPDHNETTAANIPLYTVGVDECRSTGNMIGFYFEAISFAQEEGFALGRTEFPRKCSDSQKDLLRMLPKVVLPYVCYDNFTKDVCSKMLRYPWENPDAYMYRHMDLLGFVNNKMVKSYVESKQLVISGLQRSIAIHYRCGDNFPLGLFPHDVYIQILGSQELLDIATKAIPMRVVIHTDAVKGKQWGDPCWDLLGELTARIALMPQYTEATISIQHSLPAHAYVYLHLSDVIICGTSSFCIMSTIGANLAYIPYGTYLMRLEKPFASNIRLYNATMVKCLNNATAPHEEIAKACKEPVHHQLWLEKMRNQTTSIVMSS